MPDIYRVAFAVGVVMLLAATSFAATQTNSFQQISAAGYSYELIIDEPTPDVMKPLPVRLLVRDIGNEPVTEAQITCSLTMPSMAMPKNMPPVKESSNPGQYDSTFLLTMGGLWNVELKTVYKSGAEDSVVIAIPGVMPTGNSSDVDAKLEALFQENKASTQ